ncbi:hypothetical protein KW790_03125 [Candidatus Parcubacteria bacterium]|nr:hypothetical protein [Candidatus Parcubacteria bacterium]
MDPKFQSSFIPKGPLASSATLNSLRPHKQGSLLGFIGGLVFTLAVLASLGVFGYKFYLSSEIGKKGAELDSAQASLQLDSIKDLSRLNTRIVSVKQLLGRHTVVSKLFEFLEANTLRTVRFTDFGYNTTNGQIKLQMRGLARGYASVAQQSDIFNKSNYLKNVIFSDLSLDERGNVTFVFSADIDSSLVTLQPGRISPQTTTPNISTSSTSPFVATSTATSTLKTSSTSKTTTH